MQVFGKRDLLGQPLNQRGMRQLGGVLCWIELVCKAGDLFKVQLEGLFPPLLLRFALTVVTLTKWGFRCIATNSAKYLLDRQFTFGCRLVESPVKWAGPRGTRGSPEIRVLLRHTAQMIFQLDDPQIFAATGENGDLAGSLRQRVLLSVDGFVLVDVFHAEVSNVFRVVASGICHGIHIESVIVADQRQSRGLIIVQFSFAGALQRTEQVFVVGIPSGKTEAFERRADFGIFQTENDGNETRRMRFRFVDGRVE